MSQTTPVLVSSEAPAALMPDAGAAGEVAALPRDDFDRRVWCVLGMPVDAADVAQAAAAVQAAARDGRRLSFVTPNLNWLARVLRDRDARRQVIDADLSLADGMPVAMLARLVGAPVRARAAGSDVFEALRASPGFRGRRLRVFFFGGRDGAADAAAAALARDGGGLEAAGALNPGHGDVESMSGDATIDHINAARPDFLVVSLGAAKGQAWIDRNQARLVAPVIAHLGAVVDFTAGSIRRAPPLWRRLGLEWLWRIREEPGLWRRYAGDAVTLLTRGLPALAPQLLASRSARAPLTASVERRADAVIVSLAGDAVEAGLTPARPALREAAAAGQTVLLDFSRLGRMDGGFLGLLLMLEKHAARAGRRIELIGASPAHLAALRRNAMIYNVFDAAAARLDGSGRAVAAQG